MVTDRTASNPIRPLRARIARALTCPVLVATMLVVSVPLSGCKTKAAAAPERKSTGAEVFAGETDTLVDALDAAKDALGQGSVPSTDLAAIASFSKRLGKLDSGVRDDFAKTRGILKKVGSPEKDAIQQRVEADYAKRLAELKRHLKDIERADGSTEQLASVTALSRWLDEITPDAPHQPLGTELPNRIVDAKAGPPVLGTAIAPAYAPNTPGAVPSTLPVTPTAEDLAETVEVVFTPEIRALATTLSSDPVLIYEHVRNTIDFEPYYGSRKGAEETWLEGSGNDIDTASLLIALMRVSGIPARYVSGVVEVPIAQAMNWVGVETPEAAAKLFSAGGTPTKSVVSGGRVIALQIEHTWAEVYVRYEDYRGAGEGTGPKRWIPLDASFKQYAEGEAAPPPVPPTSCIATANPDEFARLLEERRDMVASWGATHTAVLSSIVRSRRVVGEDLGLLPCVLTPRAIKVTAEETAAPFSEFAVVSIEGGSSVRLPIGAAANSRITVDYVPADDEALQLIEQYGSVLSVPAYLLVMVPVIWVDGEPLAIGSERHLGETQEIQVALESGCGTTVATSRQLIVGGRYGLVFDAGTVGPRHLGAVRDQLGLTVSLAETTSVGGERLAGGILRATGLQYFSQADAGAIALAEAAGVAAVHLPSFLVAGIEVRGIRTLGVPTAARLAGSSLDVRRNAYAAVSADGSETAVRVWSLMDGISCSALEHLVYEEVLDVNSVSTVKVLAEAVRRGVPLLTVRQDNCAEELALLDAEPAFRSFIRDTVNSGHVVVTPAQEVPVGEWRGRAWIDLAPESGSAGFMIDSLAGTFTEEYQKWYSTGLGACVDVAHSRYYHDERLGAGGRWVDSVKRNKMVPNADAQATNALLDKVAILVMPLLMAFEQAWTDIDDPSLGVEARAERALMTWIWFQTEAIAAMLWIAPLGASLGGMIGGPYGAAIGGALACALVGALVSWVWDCVKDDVYWYYGVGPAPQARARPVRGRAAAWA